MLLGDRYLRVNPELPRPIGMDEVAASLDLISVADCAPIEDVLSWLTTRW
jgi:hypothetical protein